MMEKQLSLFNNTPAPHWTDTAHGQGAHPHSREAFHSGRKKFSKRAQEILDFLSRQTRAVTRREIMLGLGYSDINSVSPRITELLHAGAIRRGPDVVCPITHRPVDTFEVNK